MTAEIRSPTERQLRSVFQTKYGPDNELDWGPRTRRSFRYHNPDDWYEALVESLVTSGSRWLDVGCGRDIFPSNKRLAEELSSRCKLLVGTDPDLTILENPFLHEKQTATIEQFSHESKFDLITLRMVAEHIEDPTSAVAALAKLASEKATIVIYTVNKYSPVPLITNLVPFSARHVIKQFIWGTEEKDTFPTAFKLNSRKDLTRYATENGLREELFIRIDDCRSLARWRTTLILELGLRRALNAAGLRYPEQCLIAAYSKE